MAGAAHLLNENAGVLGPKGKAGLLLIVRTNTNCENMGCDLLGLRNIQQNNQYDTLIKRTPKGPWLRELPTWSA